jgi:hypothetical protein
MMHDISDAIDLWWWEGVVNYDGSRQYRMASRLWTGLDNFQDQMRTATRLVEERLRAGIALLRSPVKIMSLAKRWASWAPLSALIVVGMIPAVRRRILALFKRVGVRRNPKLAATAFYRDAMAILGAQGLKREYGQTPVEFVRSLGNHPAAEVLMSLTRMYNAVRFGHPEAATFSHLEAETLLRALRASLTK